MANFAETFKAEITRLARKEMKREIAALRKTTTTQRNEISSLRKEVRALTQAVKKSAKAVPAPSEPAIGADVSRRFSAKGLASHRKRLGLSAIDLGRLVEASAQSVHNWEAGTTKPGAKHIASILGLRRIGRREAMARLAEQER